MGKKLKRLRRALASKAASVPPPVVEPVTVAPVPEPAPIVEELEAKPKKRSSLRSRLGTKRTRTKKIKE